MSIIVADTFKARVVGAAITTEKGLNVGGATTIAGAIIADGTVTASSFSGDGSNLTGVTGFATALSNSGFLNSVFQTPKSDAVSAGTSVQITGEAGCGNIVFTRLGRIDVGTGATITVSTGTTFIMNVLSVF
tara:strand:+ start:390 stop:785 length:396 start_codon:yes stop_codon:yes gene_type:complete